MSTFLTEGKGKTRNGRNWKNKRNNSESPRDLVCTVNFKSILFFSPRSFSGNSGRVQYTVASRKESRIERTATRSLDCYKSPIVGSLDDLSLSLAIRGRRRKKSLRIGNRKKSGFYMSGSRGFSSHLKRRRISFAIPRRHCLCSIKKAFPHVYISAVLAA